MNPEAVVPDLAELVGRLKRHAEYISLVAAQLDAAAHRDVARLRGLDAEREEFEEVHFTTVEEGTEEARSPDQSIHDDLLRGLTLLVEQEEEELRSTEQWSRLEDGAVRSARLVRPPRVRAAEYPDYKPEPPQVDLRL